MKFKYQKYQGEITEYELQNWREVGHYIQGVCLRSHAFKTFRKDRISAYLDGSETLLSEPYPPGKPCIPVRRDRVRGTKRNEKPNAPQILFTGFPAALRTELERTADEAGFWVRQNGVTRELNFLCTGPNAGPAKIQQARAQGTYILPACHFTTFVETGELPDEEQTSVDLFAEPLTEAVSETSQIETRKRQRVPLTSIAFTDCKGDIKGYAKGWYFWVHTSFQEALDIRRVEQIEKNATAALRDKKSLELFGVTHVDLKRRIEATGQKLGDSKEHKKIMTFTVSDGGCLTESTNPQYEFRVTDGVESRTGEWYLQVGQTAETDGAPGSIGFNVYSRNHSPLSGEGIWIRRTWLSTSQRDFVALLQTGRCSVIDLENPPAFDDAQG